ncbi:MAG: hypothetical protein H3C27_01210 [Opitutaceae bacterium]|nr:hypothetical protein [Opitutaceae bacterium]
MEKLKARKLVEAKVAKNMPITEEERVLLYWRAGKVKKDTAKTDIIAASADKMIVMITRTGICRHYPTLTAFLVPFSL